MLIYFWIGVGSALGGMARFWLSGAIAHRYGETFPLGTLLVNVSGSFIIGFFATLTGTEGRLLVDPMVRQFFMIGICGGYTTFSSFSLQTFNLLREGNWLYAILNSIYSVLFCLLAVWLGHLLAAYFNQLRGS